jgi:redox-sensitive bicupin YhaK (pirin superfamily)
VHVSRTIERLVTGQATSDGAGVKLSRILTQDLQHRLDPFLMLDAFGSDKPDDYIAGFPDHPHRGFETVTYMIAGRMLHRDSAGNEGLLQNGGVQWMTAGQGVIHSEIPQQADGVMEGFQLWLNLHSSEKMQAPWYRDFQRRGRHGDCWVQPRRAGRGDPRDHAAGLFGRPHAAGRTF